MPAKQQVPKVPKKEPEHVATDGAELQAEQLRLTTPLGRFILRVSQMMAATNLSQEPFAFGKPFQFTPFDRRPHRLR